MQLAKKARFSSFQRARHTLFRSILLSLAKGFEEMDVYLTQFVVVDFVRKVVCAATKRSNNNTSYT